MRPWWTWTPTRWRRRSCWPSRGCRRWWSPTLDGSPHSILPASQVVRFLVPSYVQDDPSLARVMNESIADRAGDKLGGKRVRDLLPRERRELPAVNHDDTIIEVAAIMARLRCPLAAVMKDGRLIGVISASRLLELALHTR